jgi:hypothetical protein
MYKLLVPYGIMIGMVKSDNRKDEEQYIRVNSITIRVHASMYIFRREIEMVKRDNIDLTLGQVFLI